MSNRTPDPPEHNEATPAEILQFRRSLPILYPAQSAHPTELRQETRDQASAKVRRQAIREIIERVFATCVDNSKQVVFAARKDDRLRIAQDIENNLRPHLLKAAAFDAAFVPFTSRGIRPGFPLEFNQCIIDALIKSHGIELKLQFAIMGVLRNLETPLLVQYAATLPKKGPTDHLKSQKLDWRDDLKNNIIIPNDLKQSIYLILDEYVDSFVQPYWELVDARGEI